MTNERDRDLQQRIHNFLLQKNVIRRGAVRVQVSNGLASLSGNVGSYYEKQLVVNATQHVAGVVSIDDSLDVIEEDAPVAVGAA